MVKLNTLKERAIIKVLMCIESCKTYEHLASCKRMINFLYDYDVKKSTLTYVSLKYRSKHLEIHGE